ncbi:MAG: FAD-dependent oxidoreductase [Deltaproteobacteria bacterium]|nr:FAD-dependent oxidoreductase [Deltaproteobacteria bacterium]MBW2121295.1 FAD-dependent oxidoreductase [Deltaproteobacteria bacterium]HDZ91677.1 FAD-dependent oxidoreductase [Deltaproteobacteria bacterium]
MGPKELKKGVVVVGGGPAGLAAAVSAKASGCDDVVIIERGRMLGGILNQCIHDGFGLHRFKEALSGPEYAQRFIDQVQDLGIETLLNTMVLSINDSREILASSREGLFRIRAGAVVLAMGCRERTAGAIFLPGTRPAGVYTAGVAQNLINLQNIMVGEEAVIMGSGDIGLIMARRLALEGASVKGVYEILPYPSGLPRNIQQCLKDFGIPLHLSTTVVELHGRARLKGVTVARVDEARRVIQGTESFIPCDTLLLSVGLIPENELSREAGVAIEPLTGGALVDDTLMTSVEGVFSCGNVLHVHDLVDHVSEEADMAGHFAARFAVGEMKPRDSYIPIAPGRGVRYVLPQKISGEMDVVISLRVAEPMEQKAIVGRDQNGRGIFRKKQVKLHPAVMMRIKVKKEKLQGVSSMEVGVEG